MNNKLKNVLKVVLFVTGLAIILLGISKWFVPKNNLEAMGMHQPFANGILGEEKDTVDIVILGDSEAFTSINPMQLWNDYGFTTYACGTSSQILYDTENFLKKTLKNQNPKVVLLEVNTIFRNFSIKYLAGAMGRDIFPIFRYHNRWKMMTKNDFFGKVKYNWSDDLKGFNISKNKKKPEIVDYMKYTDELESISLLNKYFLEKIVNTCKENNIKLIFYSVPSPINCNYKKHNKMLEYAKEKNLEFIDFNLMIEELQLDWEQDSRDKGDHLNYYGAIKLTNYMGNYLNNLNILENHHGDSKYSKWNDAYQKYLQVIKEK